jgi:hypothetical protein
VKREASLLGEVNEVIGESLLVTMIHLGSNATSYCGAGAIVKSVSLAVVATTVRGLGKSDVAVNRMRARVVAGPFTVHVSRLPVRTTCAHVCPPS